VRFPLLGDAFGTAEERTAVRALETQLTTALESAAVGELDGQKIGGGEVVLYAYGPDATRLFAAIEAKLRTFPARPAHALPRFGEAAQPHSDRTARRSLTQGTRGVLICARCAVLLGSGRHASCTAADG
jgi:hypothetical protein